MKDFVTGKKTPSKNKKNPQVSKLLIFLGFFLGFLSLSFFILKSLRFGDFFRSFENQTVLLIHRDVNKSMAYLLTADFADLTLAVTPLDTEIEIDLGDYGYYRFQSVYPLLASVEKKPLNFVRSTYSFSLGRVIDEVWGIDGKLGDFANKNEVKKIFFSPNIWQLPGSLVNHIAWLALISDGQTEFLFNDLETSFPLEKRVKNTDSSLFLCTIAIINTTSVNGLAGKIENVLAADGFSIIRTDSDDQVLAKTELVMSADEKSQNNCQRVQKKITRLLPGEADLKINDEVTTQYRADLVVKLGEDLKN